MLHALSPIFMNNAPAAPLYVRDNAAQYIVDGTAKYDACPHIPTLYDYH